MQIPAERWLKALEIRKSRRQFNGKTIDPTTHAQLLSFSQELNSHISGVRTVIVSQTPDDLFKGAVGSYGKIKGAPAYAAFIGNMQDPKVQEKLGYMGECFILEATALQLGTCWVGGFFRPDVVARDIHLAPEEKVLAVTPIGYVSSEYNREEKLLSGLAASRNRKHLTKLCSGLPEEQWPAWIRTALAAARVSPSAVNRQPWRFTVSEQAIKISVDSTFTLGHVSKRLDCGIALLHLQIGALAMGVQCELSYLDNPEVAVLNIKQ